MKLFLYLFFIIYFLCVVNHASAKTPADSPLTGERLLLLDDFETGVDAGWSVAGDSRFIRYFNKKLVWPGCQSKLALRLTRIGNGGWTGLALDNLDRLKLEECDGVYFQARNHAGVNAIKVDVFLADGSRWYGKFPLKSSGEWTPIVVNRFSPIDNPKKTSAPDLRAITRIWIIMEHFSGGDDVSCSMDIDDVSLIGKPRQIATSVRPVWQPVSPSAVNWGQSKKRIMVLDTEQFPPVGQIAGFGQALAQIVESNGGQVSKIAPQDFAANFTRQSWDLLILNGPGYVQSDGRLIVDYLKNGGAIWFVGPHAPMSRPLIRSADGQWADADDAALSRETETEIRRAIGQTWTIRSPFDLAEPVVSVTENGRKWWPEISGSLPAVRSGSLSLIDSIDRMILPPWVSFEPLFQVKYRKKNWIRHDDVFTAALAAMYRFSAGDNAGARILVTAFSGETDSCLNPAHPAFVRFAAVCLSKLSEPVNNLHPLPEAPLAGLPLITRENYLKYPGPIFMPLNFGGPPADNAVFWKDLAQAGFNVVHSGIPWLKEAAADGEVVNWPEADRIVRDVKSHGRQIVFDGYSFYWPQFKWTGTQTFHNPTFCERFYGVLNKLAGRYKDEPSVVAVYATPLTGGFGAMVNETSEGLAAWRAFVRDHLKLSLADVSQRYGMPINAWDELMTPKPTDGQSVNTGPMWADYIQFHTQSYIAFIRGSVQAIRRAAPDMPVLIRANYLDSAVSMAAAAEFKNVAAHIECVETTPDTEAYFCGLGRRFGIPVSAENGWPKIRGGPLRMALADYLMGGYADFQYSFDGPRWAIPGTYDLHQVQKVSRILRQAKYPSAAVGLLVPDTTLYASRPPNFFSMEKLPHIEFLMERSGIVFESVASQFPRLDGLKIIVDDGSNYVLTPELRDELIRWVRRGGTLLGFPSTGRWTLDNSTPLYKALLIEHKPSGQPVTYRAGSGKVVIFPDVPKLEQAEPFENMLLDLGASMPVRVRPRVNQAFFEGNGRKYMVIFDKSRDYVGSFFRESHMADVEKHLPDRLLAVQPSFQFKVARELITGKLLPVKNSQIEVELSATHYRVVEFE